MKKLLTMWIIAILFVISFSGCVEEDVITAVEIKERFLQALENVTSYKYSSNANATMTTIKKSTNTTEYSIVTTGEIDVLNKRVKQYMNTTSEDSNETHLIVYLIDNITYYGNQTDGNTTWTSSIWGSEFFYAYSLLEQITMFLEDETLLNNISNMELKRLSDEKFENVDCYILQFTGFRNQSSTISNAYNYAGYDIKYWIAKNTNLLKKSIYRLINDLTGVYSFGGANRSIITSEMELLFYDYNVPLNIELPPEAKNTNPW